MSDYEDYDYGDDAGGDAPKQKGLTANTVLQIRKFILGDYDGPVEPLIEDRPHILALADSTPPPQQPRKGGRFAPGQSGNPNGRPTKAFSIRGVPEAEIDQDKLADDAHLFAVLEIPVTKNGETVLKTIETVIAEVQVKKALNGDTAAARLVDSLVLRARRAQAHKRARDYAMWKDRRSRYAEIHERHRKREPHSLYWSCPHPDDILLGPGHEVKVVGPMSPTDLLRTQERYERSTFWLMLATYEGWMQVRRAKSHPDCPHVHAELVSSYMFEAEQQLLPPRLRMARAEVEAQVQEWSDMAGRALHDLLRAEAAKVGMPVPPRALRIPFTVLHPLAEQLVSDRRSDDRDTDGSTPLDDIASLKPLFGRAWAAPGGSVEGCS